MAQDLAGLPAVELMALYRAGELSPVAHVEACIAQIERVNPVINAMNATCFARARAEAQASEDRHRRGQAHLPDIHPRQGISPLLQKFLQPLQAVVLKKSFPPILAKTGAIQDLGFGSKNTRNDRIVFVISGQFHQSKFSISTKSHRHRYHRPSP